MTVESEEEFEEETKEEIEKEEEDSQEHFDTFPTMKELRCVCMVFVAFSGALVSVCSFMLCDLDFEPLSLSLSSLPSCDLESLTNIFILCLILKASNQSWRKSLSLNLELS
ncbi:hypothetical protein Tco_0089759 [Tanacetum coccineum]